MVYKVPELDTDSSPTCSTRSYYSIENLSAIPISSYNMASCEHTDNDTDMGNTISSLSSDDLRELLILLREKRSASSAVPSTVAPMKREAALPKWTGQPEDLDFYLERLETRIEMDMEPYFLPAQICMDMIDTLPDNKKCRVESWFKGKKASGRFNWRELLICFRNEFQDNQAQQAALETLERMEQGQHQFFMDYLKEFELKVAQSGGIATHTLRHQTMLLKGSLNRRLRRSLLGLKLPPPENYSAWVAEVKEIAAELESFDDYRPKGSTLTVTKLGAIKGGIIRASHKAPELDAEGDTIMSGTNNGLLAAIAELIKSNSNNSIYSAGPSKGKKLPKSKPRAKWRSKEEFRRLRESGACIRCELKGHLTKDCRKFDPALRPKTALNAALEKESDSDEFEDSDSGKDQP